jgi:hypothetical protein
MDLKPSCPLSLYIDLRAQLDSLFSFPFSVGLTQQDVLRRFVFLEQDKKSGGRSWSAASTAAAKVSASPPSLSLSLSLSFTHTCICTRVSTKRSSPTPFCGLYSAPRSHKPWEFLNLRPCHERYKSVKALAGAVNAK